MGVHYTLQNTVNRCNFDSFTLDSYCCVSCCLLFVCLFVWLREKRPVPLTKASGTARFKTPCGAAVEKSLLWRIQEVLLQVPALSELVAELAND